MMESQNYNINKSKSIIKYKVGNNNNIERKK